MSEEHHASFHRFRILGLALAALVFIAAAAAGAATVTLPGCAGCHMQTPGFEEPTRATAHAAAGTSCVACHVQTGRVISRTTFGVYEAFGMWVPLLDPASTAATAITDANCLTCHAAVLDATIESGGIRMAHASCAAGATCMTCHSEVGHGSATKWPRASSMNDCTNCHRTMKVSLTCETCHTGDVVTTSWVRPEFAVTHGSTWRETHGMGDMRSCSVCHGEDACSKCHGPGVPHTANFLLSHAETSLQENSSCLSCHDEVFCYSCHLTEMPHPRAFIQSHKETVSIEGETPCLRCHSPEDCDTCHVKHVHPGGAVGAIPSPGRSGN